MKRIIQFIRDVLAIPFLILFSIGLIGGFIIGSKRTKKHFNDVIKPEVYGLAKESNNYK